MYYAIKMIGPFRYFWNGKHDEWTGLVDNATPMDQFTAKVMCDRNNGTDVVPVASV